MFGPVRASGPDGAKGRNAAACEAGSASQGGGRRVGIRPDLPVRGNRTVPLNSGTVPIGVETETPLCRPAPPREPRPRAGPPPGRPRRSGPEVPPSCCPTGPTGRGRSRASGPPNAPRPTVHRDRPSLGPSGRLPGTSGGVGPTPSRQLPVGSPQQPPITSPNIASKTPSTTSDSASRTCLWRPRRRPPSVTRSIVAGSNAFWAAS